MMMQELLVKAFSRKLKTKMKKLKRRDQTGCQRELKKKVKKQKRAMERRKTPKRREKINLRRRRKRKKMKQLLFRLVSRSLQPLKLSRR
jgi:hypothetical protein